MTDDVLPPGWASTTVGQIGDVVKVHIVPEEHPETKFNYLSIENIESDTGKLVNFSPTLGRDIHSPKIVFKSTDILYSKLRPYLNKVHLPTFGGVSATDLIPIRPRDGISREFMAYFLRTPKVVEYANQRTRGIQLPRLPVGDLLSMEIPVPPLAEQRRIVHKIDELFQELRTVREALERISSLMKQFRQSVLAKAYRGELADGRRIKWTSAELRSVIKDVKNGLYPRKNQNGPQCVILRIRDLQSGTIQSTDLLRQRVTEEESRDFTLRSGDIVLDRVNAGINLVGKVAVFDSKEPTVFNYHLMRIRVIESIVNSKFVKYFLETPSARRYIEDVSVSTAGQNSINQKQLTALRIPIAPLEEQNRIVKHIDTMFSQCDVTVVRANRAHDILASLERSILSRAFCGQLVPQDSRDESASVMLERLRDRNEHTSK